MKPHRRRRPKIPPELRLAIFARDGWRCLYCGRRFRDLPPHHRTLDHLWPHCYLGPSDPGNLIAACLECNNRRQLRPFYEFADADALRRIVLSIARRIEPYLRLYEPTPAAAHGPWKQRRKGR